VEPLPPAAFAPVAVSPLRAFDFDAELVYAVAHAEDLPMVELSREQSKAARGRTCGHGTHSALAAVFGAACASRCRL